jgi:hypothetical protein
MKKTYKLIKEYPGSPKLNTTATLEELDLNDSLYLFHYVLNDPNHQPLPENKVEDYPEFWEEVKEEKFWGVSTMKEEPNYLITAFKSKVGESIYKLLSDGRYSIGNHALCSIFPLSYMLENHTIYSVKNKYGFSYTLGDTINWEINHKKGEPFIIDNFFINRDGILLARNSKESSATCEDINEVYKVTKFLIYTTTDGVDIFEGDRVWLSLLNKDLSLHKNDLVLIGNFSKQDKEVADRYLTFTSEENRDKYIKENAKKPIFISADGYNMYDGDDFIIVNKSGMSILKMGVHHNSGKDDKCMYFKTTEAAQKYIDNNKPKYSLVDIKKAYEEAFDETFSEIEIELKKLSK